MSALPGSVDHAFRLPAVTQLCTGRRWKMKVAEDGLMTEILDLRDYIRTQYLDPHCLWPHEYQTLLRQANDLIDDYHKRSQFDLRTLIMSETGSGGT
jgi:hypothetical protein